MYLYTILVIKGNEDFGGVQKPSAVHRIQQFIGPFHPQWPHSNIFKNSKNLNNKTPIILKRLTLLDLGHNKITGQRVVDHFYGQVQFPVFSLLGV